MITAIINAHIFDGENVLKDKIVLIDGGQISTIGGVVPTEATVIDARNAFLMPGLIDSHVHTLKVFMMHYYSVLLRSWK